MEMHQSLGKKEKAVAKKIQLASKMTLNLLDAAFS